MDEQNLTTKKKKKWLLPTIIAVIVVIAAISAIIVYNLPANRLNRQLALAEKYMSELNYEAAILAYKAAIEIDPKNVEAYHGAVEAYSLADNKDGFETLYADALTVVEELSAEELDATIELVKDIYLTASNVYDDNEKTAEVLEKGYEVTNNDPEIKSSLVVTYENIIDDYQKDETPDYDKLLDMCDKLLDLDAGNTDVSDTRKELLADYITDLLKDGDSDTAKELIDKYKEIEPDVDYEKLVEDVINELFEDEDYETVKKLADDFKETFPDMNLDDMLSELETLEQEAAQKKALMLTVFDYMSAEDYDAMLDVDGSEEADAVRDILIAHDKTSYIYIPDDDGTHTGTGVGIYLWGDDSYYFYYGDFTDGSREGNGCIFKTFLYWGTTTYVFTGEWKKDTPNGYGNVYTKNDLNGTIKNYYGELINGLWNGHINCTLTQAYWMNGRGEDEEWNLSFNAVNGIPTEISDKNGYYSVTRQSNGDYSLSLEEIYYTSPNWIYKDGYVLVHYENLNEDWLHDTTIDIALDNSRYLFAFDYHVYDDGNDYYWYSFIDYNSTLGIIGFSDEY